MNAFMRYYEMYEISDNIHGYKNVVRYDFIEQPVYIKLIFPNYSPKSGMHGECCRWE